SSRPGPRRTPSRPRGSRRARSYARRGATPPFRNLPPGPIARARPALETQRSAGPCRLVSHDGRGLGFAPPGAPPGVNRRFERRLRRRNPILGGGIGRGAQPPSEYSRQPPLAPAVMLHVAIALPLPDAGEPEVELLDVLVLADRPGVAVRGRDGERAHRPRRRRPDDRRERGYQGVLPRALRRRAAEELSRREALPPAQAVAVVTPRRGAVPPFRCLPPGWGCAGGAGALGEVSEGAAEAPADL